MALDPISTAILALTTTLRDQLPAVLLAADAARGAELVCARGPYEITADTRTLTIGATDATLTTGAAVTAATLAADIGATFTGITPSADADGRLVLTASPPTDDAPSFVKVGGGTANAALGLVEGQSTTVRLAVGDPAPIVYGRGLTEADLPDRPTVALEAVTSTAPRPVKGGIYVITLTLTLVVPGALGEEDATLDAVRALCAGVKAVVRAGDGRGRNRVGGEEYGGAIVDCLPTKTRADPKILRVPDRAFYFGVAAEEFQLRVHTTEH